MNVEQTLKRCILDGAYVNQWTCNDSNGAESNESDVNACINERENKWQGLATSILETKYIADNFGDNDHNIVNNITVAKRIFY